MIRLFTPYYEPEDAERRVELATCRLRNESNEHIGEVYTLSHVAGRGDFPCYHRATYNDLIVAANSKAGPEDISILCNSDIYFNNTLSWVKEIKPNQCYALSRWDETPNGLKLLFHWDSQDAWIFRGQIRLFAGFEIGIPGCDNRFAYEVQAAGYELLNPSNTIQAVHVHQSGLRTYDPDKKIPAPYTFVNPHNINEKSTTHCAQ